ncbi:hypothetical protein [Actinoplanes sp. TFC3]
MARNGLIAAAKIEPTSYDVMVLDRDLPGPHGDLPITTQPGIGYRII